MAPVAMEATERMIVLTRPESSRSALRQQNPEQAFFVRCDSTNNPAFDLELGRLRVDVYAAPCGVAERILVGVFRTPIGQVPQ